MRSRLAWYVVGFSVGAWVLHALVDWVLLGGSAFTHLAYGFNAAHLVHRLVLVFLSALCGVVLAVQSQRLRDAESLREDLFEKYRTMADFTWDWEYWVDEKESVVYMSPSCERITGYPPDAFVRNPDLLRTVVHPQYRAAFEQHRCAVAADRNIVCHEVFPIVRPDGGERWIDHYCLPVFDRRGNWRGRRCSNRDITEQKRAEELVHLTRYSVEHAGDGLFWIAADGAIRYANEAAARMTGRSREKLLTMHVWDVWPDTSPERWPAQWEALRRETTSTGEYRLRRAAGSDIPVEVRLNYLTFEGQEYNFVFVRDISDRKNAAEAIAQRERMFRSIVEASPLGMHFYRLESDGRLVFEGANPAADRVIGIDHRQFMGLTIEEAFPALAGTEVPERYRTAARDGTAWNTEQYVYEDRRVRGAFDVHAFQTVPGHMVALFEEITERVRARLALQESEQKLRAFVDKSSEGIVLSDERGRIVLWNPAVAAMTGVPADRAVGADAWDIMVNLQLPERRDPQYLAQLRERLEAFFHRMPEESRTLEMPYLHADGSRRYVRQTMFGIATPSGRYSVSLLTDITERVVAETALREREQQLAGIFRAAPAGIGVVANRVFRQVNERVCEMTGYTANELVGHSARMVYPTDEDYEYVGRVKYAQIQERGWGSVETRWRRKDGTVMEVLLSSCPLDTSDLTKGVVFTVLDITEQKQMHEALRRSRDELEERVRERTAQLQAANAELESFAYTVSHDLRVPLRGIDGFSQILREEHAARLDPEGVRLLDVIRASTRRMGELIDDLLQFSRLGKTALRYASVDLGTFVADVVRELKPVYAGRTVRFDVGVLPVACGDPILLRQVLANLLANAVKFTRTRRVARIAVRGRRLPDGIECVVRDNGVGFDMQYAHKLFSIFQRLHHQDEFEGTGIGLATVKRIVEKHGGEVWAEGRPGRGATIGFRLPDAPCRNGMRPEPSSTSGG